MLTRVRATVVLRMRRTQISTAVFAMLELTSLRLAGNHVIGRTVRRLIPPSANVTWLLVGRSSSNCVWPHP